MWEKWEAPVPRFHMLLAEISQLTSCAFGIRMLLHSFHFTNITSLIPLHSFDFQSLKEITYETTARLRFSSVIRIMSL
jgi:hypothetical protein